MLAAARGALRAALRQVSGSMQHRGGGLVAAVTFGCSSATSLTRHNSFGPDLLAP